MAAPHAKSNKAVSVKTSITRRAGEALRIADGILVHVIKVERERVKLGVEIEPVTGRQLLDPGSPAEPLDSRDSSK